MSKDLLQANAERNRIYGAILGLKGDETLREIRHAYQRKIAWYHPDKLDQLTPALRRAAEEEARKLREAYVYFRDVRQV